MSAINIECQSFNDVNPQVEGGDEFETSIDHHAPNINNANDDRDVNNGGIAEFLASNSLIEELADQLSDAKMAELAPLMESLNGNSNLLIELLINAIEEEQQLHAETMQQRAANGILSNTNNPRTGSISFINDNNNNNDIKIDDAIKDDDATAANAFANPDYNATINLLKVLNTKTIVSGKGKITSLSVMRGMQDKNADDYKNGGDAQEDRFGLIAFYENDYFGSNKCYYNVNGDSYCHSIVKNGGIDGNCNNYASSLYYCETTVREFIDLYFLNSISISDELRVKFGNKSISYISDLILLYFDSCVRQFSRTKDNLSPFGKMILFNHFDNIGMANEMAEEEKEKVQLQNIKKNVENIRDIIKVKTSKFDKYLRFGKAKIDEYYIGYNNGCVFNDNGKCSYCLQIGVFGMTFKTSVEFLKDFSDNNNNNHHNNNHIHPGWLFRYRVKSSFTHSKFHQLCNNSVFKKKYENKVDVNYLTFEHGTSVSQRDFKVAPFNKLSTLDNIIFDASARIGNKNDSKRAIKGEKVAKKLIDTTMYIGKNEHRSKSQYGRKTFLTQPNGVFKIRIIDNTMNNDNVGYYDPNYCRIEIECNLDYSMTTMDKLHTIVGTIDFAKLLGNGNVQDRSRSINDRIVFLPAVTATGCDVCKNENCGFNFYVSHVRVE